MELAPILDIRQLNKSYPTANGPLVILRDISFSLAPGMTCALVGPSGSGKTTLLALCAGLDEPTSGDVILDGANLQTLDENGRAQLRNRSVGFVFQSYQLIPTLTALENVMVPLELAAQKPARDCALQWLQKVGLEPRLTHFPAQLSGGEQQRVALARAFVNQPKILFADEPTGNLDPETGHRIIDMLFELNAAANTALVLVTHDPEIAQRARRIIRLKGGAIIDQSPTFSPPA